MIHISFKIRFGPKIDLANNDHDLIFIKKKKIMVLNTHAIN
jgi:hypothetical protein